MNSQKTKPQFISVPFKAASSNGMTEYNGIAKFSPAGIVFEFDSMMFGLIGGEVKEVRVALKEIEDVKNKRRFFKYTLEIWLNNFRTLSEIPNKDGRIILQISKDDRPRAEEGIRILHSARSESDALEILQTPVSRLFDETEETPEWV